MMPDYQYQEYQRERKELEEKGYSFEITSQGYKVWLKGEFVSAAGSIEKPHGRYAKANVRDHLQAAVSTARQHASPVTSCDMCGKDMHDNDKGYGTTSGIFKKDFEGFGTDEEPWLTTTCESCGEFISDAIGRLIVEIRSQGLESIYNCEIDVTVTKK